MPMETLTLRIEPLAPFGTPLIGDTLFGQLCWSVLHRMGEGCLGELLEGYTEGQPFAVVSDALPSGHLLRPVLPLSFFNEVPDADRKRLKRQIWLPLDALTAPLPEWLRLSRTEQELTSALASRTRSPGAETASGNRLTTHHPQPHNTINRLTGTTGRGDFAPYTLLQSWHARDLALDCRVVFDETRIDADQLFKLFEDMGATGFGRDASIGLGKFRAQAVQELWPSQPHANACLTLAPCAPQGMGFDSARSFYEVFTRFGRHGDAGVHLGNPFKTPVLLARSGALLAPNELPRDPFVGQGLGGAGRLSKVIQATVHQGYAPMVPVHLPDGVVA
jgi:CRISPR-associated protein Csm4